MFRLTAPTRAQLPVYTSDSLLSRFLKKLFEPLPEECRCFWLGTVIFQLWISKPWLPFKDFRSRLNSLTIWKQVYHLENLFNFILLKYRFLIFFVHKNINIFTLLEQFVNILEYLHKFSQKNPFVYIFNSLLILFIKSHSFISTCCLYKPVLMPWSLRFITYVTISFAAFSSSSKVCHISCYSTSTSCFFSWRWKLIIFINSRAGNIMIRLK